VGDRRWRISVRCVAATGAALGCSRGLKAESEATGALAVTPVNTGPLPPGTRLSVRPTEAVALR
jgi:hypothetical protein